jgi:hypothetical protein
LVFGKGDTVIMERLELPDVKREWEEIFKMMDEIGLKLSEKDIQDEIAAVRNERRAGKVRR